VALSSAGFDIAKEDLLNIGEEIHREKYQFKMQEGFSLDNYRLPERIFETASLVGKIDKVFVKKVVKCVNNEIFK
jgi:aldehyde:ferredoxin oxidoreductase